VSRLTLRELRGEVLGVLDGTWQTPTDVQHRLDLGSHYWYRVALICERLAGDGVAELRGAGTRVRRFRRRAT
jgi:hypothetical protein